jgi:hypothetical protein
MRVALEGLRKAVGGRRRGGTRHMPNRRFWIAGGAENLRGGALEFARFGVWMPERAVPSRVSEGELKPVRG